MIVIVVLYRMIYATSVTVVDTGQETVLRNVPVMVVVMVVAAGAAVAVTMIVTGQYSSSKADSFPAISCVSSNLPSNGTLNT